MHKIVIGELVDVMANLLQGFLYAIVIVVLLMVVLSMIDNRKKLSPLSLLIGGCTVILLAIQISCIIGAYDISSTTSTITDVISMVSPTAGHIASSLTRQDVEPYVIRKVIWCVVILVIGGAGMYVTMARKRSCHVSFDDYDSNSGSSTNEWGI